MTGSTLRLAAELPEQAATDCALLGVHPHSPMVPGVVAALLGCPRDQVGERLEPLLRRHLLMADPEGSHTFASRHVRDKARWLANHTLPAQVLSATRLALLEWYLAAARATCVLLFPLDAHPAPPAGTPGRQYLRDVPDSASGALEWLACHRQPLLEVLTIAAERRDWMRVWLLAYALRSYGLCLRDTAAALVIGELEVKAAENCRELRHQVWARLRLGNTLLDNREPSAAMAQAETVEEEARAAGHIWAQVSALGLKARIFVADNDSASAREVLGEGEALLADADGDPRRHLALLLLERSALERADQAPGAARQLASRANNLLRQACPRDWYNIGRALLLDGQARRDLGMNAKAAEKLAKAAHLFSRASALYELAETYQAWGELRLGEGKSEGAYSCFQKAASWYSLTDAAAANRMRIKMQELRSATGSSDHTAGATED
ncbi:MULTISPECIES: hypothetical protein [unclassified Crossiella]|uniref:hypothetical protein n=1 Tax=unclassified Crossiella TaxID=2620835 RepID=UPI001FFF74E6|nr:MULTISPECIES: hypothetical protein [unclassified Crossiella]MCK2245252.1 hypothetical protein [Crossiella sp. S99.2]MCK2258905.1 hypothetical protein [Crossiella sp. S99.1]